MSAAEGPILETRDVVKTFGGLRALDACSVAVRPRTITGLIGPNGAGKSTLFNTIVGLFEPDSGEIWFQGERIDREPPYRLVGKGLVKTFQIPRELRNLTVMENVLLSAKDVPGETLLGILLRHGEGKKREYEIQVRAEELLEFVGMHALRDEYAKNLSGGQKKLLELTRALMSDPSVILLDEPVAGVNPTLAAKIMDLIEKLRQQGKTIFLIEHDMDIVMNRCDWIVVLHQGRKLAEGPPASVKADAKVVDAYLGG
ncbi:MAG TPA: ABC transporter ATP-binding protein [Thermoplasmata archaeon]|jgi:branched-chain amino acid transport system ATP-binding protein|nr:ABC transporter ATP-binding protein [Thermoplasmata archaeon]